MASKVLTNAATVYTRMTPGNRRKFLGVLNPHGWEVGRSGAIRTPTEAFVYRCFNAKNMGSRGKWYARGEQVRTIDSMIDWLREFWRLHEGFVGDPVTAKLLAA